MSLASRKLIQATAGATTVDTGDDDFANVVLLLDGDGTGGDANNTFTDSSTNGFTFTESGSVVQGSFSPYGDNWSNYFGGSGNYLTYSDDLSLRLGTGDFTIEFWINQSSKSSYQTPVAKGYVSSGDYAIQTGNGDGNMIFYASGTAVATESGSTVNIGEWYHIAVVRSGTAVTIYRNGVSVATGTSSANLSTTSSLTIAQRSTYAVNGYMSNVRIVKGTAVYTSAFTPPKAPLTAVTNTTLLTCQSNRFIDNSTNSHTATLTGTPKVTPFSPFKDDDARTLTTDGGSGYFSGSDYLIKTSGVPTIGTGDFTVECWFYSNNVSAGYRCLYDGREIAPDGVGIFQNGAAIEVWTGTKQIDVSVITPNEWTHLALVRNSGSMQLYINGSASGSAVSFTSNCTSDERIIGENTVGSGYYFQGYISDLRETHSAVYTSAFTLPTVPLTAITNTELLLNFQDAGIYDRSGINNIDTVGNASLGFAPIYGTGSLAFDGTGDYLDVTGDSESLAFGTNDFTIEMWANWASGTSPTYQFLYDSRPTSTNGVYPCLYLSGNQLVWYVSAGAKITSSTLADNTWHHIAICRSSGSTKLFVNGVQEGSTYTDSNNYLNPASRPTIGREGYGTSWNFNGYIDDLRVTKGVARYTSNFTPPDEIDLSTDTYVEYVTLFLDGDGTVNGQNNTFTDSSTNDFTVTESGSVVQGVFSPYGDNWSNSFSSGNYYTAASDASFAFGTGDFTFEAWVNPTQYSTYNYIGGTIATGGMIFYVTSNTLRVRSFFVGDILSSSTIPEIGEWTHVAATRSGTTLRIFVNGVQTATTTDSTNYAQGAFAVGSDGTTAAPWYGNISNLRVLKGTALYTSNFTPPTSPLTNITNTSILTAQSNRFVDNSSNNHALTLNNNPKVSRFSPFESDKPYDITTDGGSAYFSGSSTDLTVSSNAALQLGSESTWTVEFWAYFVAAPDNFDVILGKGTGSGSYEYFFEGFSDRTIDILYSANGTTTWTGQHQITPAMPLNQWFHVAAVRNGATFKSYVNGEEYFSGSSFNIYAGSGALNIGGYSGAAGQDPNLYMSDVRIVKGTAVYTSAFTPPTAPLTAVTNTSLLLNFQDSAIPDLSGINNIDTVGNAKVGSTDPTKYGSNAMQFDGSGDYLLCNSSETFGYGTGDFTLECWIYKNANPSADAGIIEQRPASTNGNYPMIGLNSSGQLFYYVNAAYKISASASTALSNQAWDHVAYVRSGGNLGTLYINGTSVGTWADTTNYVSTTPLRIGEHAFSAAQFNGYIDDLRITKGVARYTANFTPPTDALPKF